MKKYTNKIGLYVINAVDLGFTTILGFFIAMFLADITDGIFTNDNNNYQITSENIILEESTEEKNLFGNKLLELFLLLWFIAIVVYVTDYIFSIIPLPLNTIFLGNRSNKFVLYNTQLFIVLYLYFQNNYKEKLKYVYFKMYEYITGIKRSLSQAPDKAEPIGSAVSSVSASGASPPGIR